MSGGSADEARLARAAAAGDGAAFARLYDAYGDPKCCRTNPNGPSCVRRAQAPAATTTPRRRWGT